MPDLPLLWNIWLNGERLPYDQGILLRFVEEGHSSSLAPRAYLTPWRSIEVWLLEVDGCGRYHEAERLPSDSVVHAESADGLATYDLRNEELIVQTQMPR